MPEDAYNYYYFENSVDYFETAHKTCLTYQIARFVEKLVDDKLIRGGSQTPVGWGLMPKAKIIAQNLKLSLRPHKFRPILFSLQ